MLTIKTGTPITISGTTTTDTIVIEQKSGAQTTLDGVNINVSTTGYESTNHLKEVLS